MRVTPSSSRSESSSRIHSSDESVDPREIRDIAVAEALILATIGR